MKFKKLLFLFISITYISINLHARVNEHFITPEELNQLLAEARQEDLGIELNALDLEEIRSINPKTSWTFIVFMAADNDLHYFAWKNLKQMEQVGSNGNISIVVQLNMPGSSPTKRYIIKKGRRVLVQDPENPTLKLNSGTTSTLVGAVEWAVTHYPADNYGLILWNHGTGAIDPYIARTINPCDLFFINPTDNKLEIDRGLSYLTLIYQEAFKQLQNNAKRGICFDDTFKSYLSNHDLEQALSQICSNVLGGKKLSLIGFDACLMSMIEITSICKNYADYFVASQEVEYGTGWRYDYVLEPFLNTSLNSQDFAAHIVHSYEQAYNKLINDYTLSALKLSDMHELEQNVYDVALILHETLTQQTGHTMADIIRKCKSTQYCTCFDEPSYIDLSHFYQNLLQHIQHINLKDKTVQAKIQEQLKRLLNQGIAIVQKIVVINKVGQKLKKAQGISIYFPEHNIPQNYLKSPFAQRNYWSTFLCKYLQG
ncbi:hypothetical protein KBD08_02885 [Candidatus Babeliales bacterium]|nr:hypothetical protein [Candidatus Babeliales bacterium]